MINTRNMTAADAYTTRLSEVQSTLELIQRKLNAHSSNHPSKQTNWAHVGDLTQLLATLEEANISI